MIFHQDWQKDKRCRFYLPVSRILKNDGVDNAEILIGNREFQTVIHYMPAIALFTPGSSLLIDFGKAIHGGIRFNNIFCSGRIRLEFGESISECIGNSNPDCSVKDTVLDLPHCGMLEYGNTVFRFVRVTNVGQENIKCLNILGVALEHDLELTGSWESSDERLNRIWKTAIRTVHLSMQDYIYDGAKRDRIVWMGDMHPEIKGILCAFSDTSIIRDSFEFLIRQAAADKPMNQIYTYSCWFIISVWDYYCVTGDREFLEKHRDYFKLMLDTFTGFIDDTGAEIIPERRFLDWPNNDNQDAKHAGLQALLLWMMNAGEKIIKTLGMDTSTITEAARRLRCHIPDPAGRKAPAALLTLTGLTDRMDVLETEPFNNVSTFYGYYILLAKKTIPALELLRRYWGAMLDFGATSFWEDFDLEWTKNATGIDEFPVPGRPDIHADFGKYCYVGLRHSLSHGWSCGPAPFLTERVLGVSFPEFGKVLVKPDLGDLEYVCGKVPVAGGVISVEADASGKINIDAPSGIEICRK